MFLVAAVGPFGLVMVGFLRGYGMVEVCEGAPVGWGEGSVQPLGARQFV